jgi:hypothetical protein
LFKYTLFLGGGITYYSRLCDEIVLFHHNLGGLIVYPWVLPLFIFFTWFVWIVGCASQVALHGARRGVPEGQRGSTSIIPGITIFPLAFWGLALGINALAPPWGTYSIGGLHVIFLISLIPSIIRDHREIRRLDDGT